MVGPRRRLLGVVTVRSLLRPVLEADFISDLPKVKTHVMTGMSCAVKNLFGTVPGLQLSLIHICPARRRSSAMNFPIFT